MSHDHTTATDWVWRTRITQAGKQWTLHQSTVHRRLFAVANSETPDRVEYVVTDLETARAVGYAQVPEGEVFETLEAALKHLRGEDDDE